MCKRGPASSMRSGAACLPLSVRLSCFVNGCKWLAVVRQGETSSATMKGCARWKMKEVTRRKNRLFVVRPFCLKVIAESGGQNLLPFSWKSWRVRASMPHSHTPCVTPATAQPPHVEPEQRLHDPHVCTWQANPLCKLPTAKPAASIRHTHVRMHKLMHACVREAEFVPKHSNSDRQAHRRACGALHTQVPPLLHELATIAMPWAPTSGQPCHIPNVPSHPIPATHPFTHRTSANRHPHTHANCSHPAQRPTWTASTCPLPAHFADRAACMQPIRAASRWPPARHALAQPSLRPLDPAAHDDTCMKARSGKVCRGGAVAGLAI